MRTIVACGAALVITAILFLLMQGLIKDRVHLVDETPASPVVDLVDVPPEESTPPKEPDEPPKVEPTPPGIPKETTIVLPPKVVKVDYELPTRDKPSPVKVVRSPAGEGDAVPIAAFPPQYPHQQLMAGVEGWVRIGFTIDVEGAVRDAEVIAASPRRGLFDAAALNAIQRWQFAPRRDASGAPVASRAEYTIEFKIDKGA